MIVTIKDYLNSESYYLDAYGVCYDASGGLYNLLFKFEETHGKGAIFDLAGAIQYYERIDSPATARQVIMHDLSISDDADAVPRSAGFGQYFVSKPK